MEALFRFLEANPYILLFLVVGMAVSMGRVTIKGYGLGMVASAIVAGAAVATAASLYGVTLQLNNFTKSLFCYLFMYGVGLRVGPSFMNSLKGDGLRFAFGVAGARSHSGPAREAAADIGSSVPWIGFPVGYAVSGVLLTVFGYVAMILS